MSKTSAHRNLRLFCGNDVLPAHALENTSPCHIFSIAWICEPVRLYFDSFLKSLGIDDPLLHIAGELEENALKDKYFIDRKLFPNVDFYSGVIYRAMGIPSDMYTVMFVLGRLPGWIAQWREMRLMNEPIGRPRQLYTGSAPRKFKSKK